MKKSQKESQDVPFKIHVNRISSFYPSSNIKSTYVFQRDDNLNVKIGASIDPSLRIKQIEKDLFNSYGKKVKLKQVYEIPYCPEAEKILHICFSRLQSHGEWFSKDVMKYIDKNKTPTVLKNLIEEFGLQDDKKINQYLKAIKNRDSYLEDTFVESRKRLREKNKRFAISLLSKSYQSDISDEPVVPNYQPESVYAPTVNDLKVKEIYSNKHSRSLRTKFSITSHVVEIDYYPFAFKIVQVSKQDYSREFINFTFDDYRLIKSKKIEYGYVTSLQCAKEDLLWKEFVLLDNLSCDYDNVIKYIKDRFVSNIKEETFG